jgi:predicted MFS family arabinose efflux permease
VPLNEPRSENPEKKAAVSMHVYSDVYKVMHVFMAPFTGRRKRRSLFLISLTTFNGNLTAKNTFHFAEE